MILPTLEFSYCAGVLRGYGVRDDRVGGSFGMVGKITSGAIHFFAFSLP
jgi:hypothetical protein